MTSGKYLTEDEKAEILKKIPTMLIADIARQLNRNRYTVSKFVHNTYKQRKAELLKEGVPLSSARIRAYKEICEGKRS